MQRTLSFSSRGVIAAILVGSDNNLNFLIGHIFFFGSYSVGPLVSDRILAARLATRDSVGRDQDDR